MNASASLKRTVDALADARDLAPTRLADTVVERLSEAILDGRLQPGDALPSEGRIAVAYGISKPIAREAIRQLAALGVVHIAQGRVARVTELDAEPIGRFFRFAVRRSRQGLAEAVEMRQIIEPPIARLAAQRCKADDVARLQNAYARMEAAIENVPAWISADLDFHAILADLSSNRLLRLQFLGLRPVLRDVMELFNARGPRSRAAWRRTLARHAAILDAVAAHDPDAAEEAMRRHFGAAKGAIRAIFPVTGSTP